MTVKFLTGFGQRPQHFLGSIGLLSFVLGLIGMTYMAVTWIIRQFDVEAFPPLYDRPLLVYSLGAVLLGAQMMSVGFIAELITAYHGREEQWYSIAEVTSDESNELKIAQTEDAPQENSADSPETIHQP